MIGGIGEQWIDGTASSTLNTDLKISGRLSRSARLDFSFRHGGSYHLLQPRRSQPANFGRRSDLVPVVRRTSPGAALGSGGASVTAIRSFRVVKAVTDSDPARSRRARRVERCVLDRVGICERSCDETAGLCNPGRTEQGSREYWRSSRLLICANSSSPGCTLYCAPRLTSAYPLLFPLPR